MTQHPARGTQHQEPGTEMNLKKTTAALSIAFLLSSCVSYNAFNNGQKAEKEKNWDEAVVQYERALEISPDNRRYQMEVQRARLEASRVHFEKGKTLRDAARQARGPEQFRLAQLASTELELTVRLDPTNQYAVVELSHALDLIQQIQQAAAQLVSIDEIKKRAQSAISKAQPPQLNPASNEPITLTFSHDTPVKDIYRALGNAFGINILFDQAVKDDRITIDLHEVTAQTALERVMQAANHFYKVLDEKTIIVVPDNPQARRDYEDLVIRTFYLSNGDAEQVTNVVRTMIEARNVFPLKALNAITIRDTADKVRIAEKIIEANDKAKAEVVVDVELVQLDLNKVRDMGLAIGIQKSSPQPFTVGADGKAANFNGGTLSDIARVVGSLNDIKNNVTFSIPTATYSLLKSIGSSELLANPELRISEGEKATLHIGQRIPVPVTTIQGYNPGGTGSTNPSLTAPYTSFQYQDVGIKVGIEPRVHHNREVTLKLTVEVSNQGPVVTFAGQDQPTFATRTIESTIRLKDGETNFLAGLIQSTKTEGNYNIPDKPPATQDRQPQPQAAPKPNPNQPPPEPEVKLDTTKSNNFAATSLSETSISEPDTAALRLAPRLAPQPSSISLSPGETKLWNIIGMDLDDLTVPELTFHFNPRAMDVTDIVFGPALVVDATAAPAIAIDREAGTIKVKPTNGKPLQFVSGGVVLSIRVHGGVIGETFLIIDNPDIRNRGGEQVVAAVAGGKAHVQ